MKSLSVSAQTGELWSPHRLWRAGMAETPRCIFCGHDDGTYDHLIIDCLIFYDIRWQDGRLREEFPDVHDLPTVLRTFGWARTTRFCGRRTAPGRRLA